VTDITYFERSVEIFSVFCELLSQQAISVSIWSMGHYTLTMFARRLSILRIDSLGARHSCPIYWIDTFSMRNFTNDAAFDNTLPIADGLLEAGHRVPLDRLRAAMEDWFRRKGYLKPDELLEILETGISETGEETPRSRLTQEQSGSDRL